MKQETLEEAAEIWINNRFTKQICGDKSYPDIYASKKSIIESHVIFAKWQQERMYSEEEAYTIWKAGQEYWKTSGASITFEELTEQFKKK